MGPRCWFSDDRIRSSSSQVGGERSAALYNITPLVFVDQLNRAGAPRCTPIALIRCIPLVSAMTANGMDRLLPLPPMAPAGVVDNPRIAAGVVIRGAPILARRRAVSGHRGTPGQGAFDYVLPLDAPSLCRQHEHRRRGQFGMLGHSGGRLAKNQRMSAKFLPI